MNAYLGNDMIGTAAYTCVEIHPLSHKFKDDFQSLSKWMKCDMGYRLTSSGKDAAWVLCEDKVNPNT